MMNPLLHKALETSELQRKNLLEFVRPWSQHEKFYYHTDHKWSVSQIIAHLIHAERLSLSYIRKKSLGIKELDNTGLVEEIKFNILKLSQRLPLRYKAPTVLGEGAPTAKGFAELVIEWNELRAELKSFVEKLDDKHIHKKIYKHPVAGRLNVIHAIRFFDEHLLHHQPQINRLLQ